MSLLEKLSQIEVMPLAPSFVLAEHHNHDEIKRDGKLLAELLLETCQRYRTPLAVALMDLTLEKNAICKVMGIPEEEAAAFHFKTKPDTAQILSFFDPMADPYLKTSVEAISHIAANKNYIPTGMAIGPFSLMTKLLPDPIIPVYLAGMGIEDEIVSIFKEVLALSMGVVRKYIEAQVEAGAEMIILCEPAANMVYFSPKQIAEGSDVFERYAMENLRELHSTIQSKGSSLFFHCCGELTVDMLRSFASLKPLVISLGSSRKLWEDEAYIHWETIIYGNLPSKKFFSDAEISEEAVYELAMELLTKMKGTGHPYILGTECDVLSVPGSHEIISRKIGAMYRAAADFKRA